MFKSTLLKSLGEVYIILTHTQTECEGNKQESRDKYAKTVVLLSLTLIKLYCI